MSNRPPSPHPFANRPPRSESWRSGKNALQRIPEHDIVSNGYLLNYIQKLEKRIIEINENMDFLNKKIVDLEKNSK